jgi:hypothetical protein
MKTLVITLDRFKERARMIAGDEAQVITSFSDADFQTPYDLLMVFLHPSADGKAWLDDNGNVVLTAKDVTRLPLHNGVVFLGTCYGLENNEMVDALFKAGARAIIGGSGENYGGIAGYSAADVLGRVLRHFLALGMPVSRSLMLAKVAAAIAGWLGAQGRADALDYELLQHKNQSGCFEQIAGVILLVVSLFSILLGGLSTDGKLLVFDSPTSPLSTATPAPTYTPWYTPAGLSVYDADFATATPCINCDPTPGAGIGLPSITYDIYLPLILNE